MPRAIWALGFVSLLMDVSSELIHSLLPVFMFTALGLSAFTIGLEIIGIIDGDQNPKSAAFFCNSGTEAIEAGNNNFII